MGVRALGAFSGGLDSMLSALVLASQGVEVHLVTFSSPFFSAERGKHRAAQLNMPWRMLDYTDTIMRLVIDPPSGLGKNCNPCIDCHTGMFAVLGKVAAEEGFDLIFSGEVLGQRPMSQNRGSLRRVARLSGYADILLRPLSAKLLEETVPEKDGLVDRERLLDISGRSRKRQMKMVRDRGLEFEAPGGGCLLTDPGYSLRLRELLDLPGLEYTGSGARLIRWGRMFRLSPRSIGMVGRSLQDNENLESLAGSRPVIELAGRPGPSAVLIGDEADLPLLAELVALFGKVSEGEKAEVTVSSGGSILTGPAPRERAESAQIKL